MMLLGTIAIKPRRIFVPKKVKENAHIFLVLGVWTVLVVFLTII